MQNIKDSQSSLIAYLKSQPTIVSLLPAGAVEIREADWQGEDFTYPNIRVWTEYVPSIDGCGPDEVIGAIDVFSEQKSSLETLNIVGTIEGLLHKRPFVSLGLRFSTVIVTKVGRPIRSIYGWQSTIEMKFQVS